MSSGSLLENLRFDHLRHHWRFYLSVLCGVVVWLLPIPQIDVTTREMRNTTLTHGVVSFFFNTVILALAVNVVFKG